VSKTIPGTTPFDGGMAQKGLCPEQDVLLVQRQGQPRRLRGRPRGLHEALRAERAAGRRHPLQAGAGLLAAGGNAYYLAKFAGIFGLDMQDIGAQQTGMTKDEFKAKLVAANDQC
jgi:protocatechuate 4,5-dioxygenase, alpha chain